MSRMTQNPVTASLKDAGCVPHRRRSRLLGSVSVLALAGMLGVAGTMPALAAEDTVAILVVPNVDGFFSDTTSGFLPAALSQINVNDVAASLNADTANLKASTITTGLNSGTSNTVNLNAFEALATGNSQVNSVDLGLIGPTGIALLATQINASSLAGQGTFGNLSSKPPVITSSVTASGMSEALYDFTFGTAVVNGNTIAAETIGSSNSSTVSGVVPTGFADTTGGSNTFAGATLTPSTLVGTVAVSTVQDNLNVGQGFGSTATVGGTGANADSITLLITPQTGTTAQVVTSNAEVMNNSLAAQYIGNNSNNDISVLGTGIPTFSGSLALSNVSANNSTMAPSTLIVDAATNTGSTISGTIVDALVGGTPVSDTLIGSLTISGNTISSSAIGNQALSPTGAAGTAGNLITLANGESFNGPAGAETSTITFVGATLTATSNANLLLFNSQSNAGSGGGIAAFTSDTEGGSISALVDNLGSAAQGGEVYLGSNAITSAATGNTATNAILATVTMPSTSTTIQGTASLSSVQLDEAAPVTALLGTTTPNSITATVGQIAGGSNVATALVTNSTVTLTSNSLLAEANGNAVGNGINLAANTVEPPATGSTPTLLSVQHTSDVGGSQSIATANATINNVQRTSDISPVTATNEDSLIAIIAAATSTISASQFTNTLGWIQASAVGNSANNALSLSATNLFSTGGIANLQSVGINTTGSNAITASVINPQVAIYAGNISGAIQTDVGVLDSSLSVTWNLLQAFAAGNQAINTLSATGTVVTVPTTATAPSSALTYNFANPGGLYFDGTTPATLQGAYDILSSQSINTTVSASVTGTAAPLLIQIGTIGGLPTAGTLNGDGAYVDNNTIFATAIGNEIAPATTSGTLPGNTLNLNFTTLPQPQNATPAGVYTPLAGITNIQELGTGGGATANVNTSGASGAPLYEVNVGGNVGENANDTVGTGATITVSNNLTQALAEGNFANNNTLNVTGTNINDGVTGVAPTSLTGLTMSGVIPPGGSGNIQAELALTVVNVQSVAAGDNVEATVQTTAGTSTGGYGALINVSGDYVVNSNLTEANNVFLATAIDNNALLNTISITGPANLAVSAGVQNLQFSAGNATAILGTPYAAGVPGSVAQIIAVGDTLGDQITDSNLMITSAPDTTPSGATAIANNAVNTLKLSADVISDSSGIVSPNATVNGGTNTLTAAADYAVQNAQVVTGSGPVATAYETLGITDFPTGVTPTPYGITGSHLAITGNGLQAVAEGNVATNTLSLTMTDSAVASNPSAALLSTQYGDIDGIQTATSGLTAYAPAAIGGLTSGTGSWVTISNNTNSALSVQNDVTNTLSVNGTNVGGLADALASYTGGVGTVIGAAASYTLNNTQYATGGGVSSIATTQIFNYDDVLAASSGIVNSQATFDNNVTTAESDANRATGGGGNSLSITATNLSASAALINFQDTAMTITAAATSSIGINLTGGAGNTPAPAASSSSLDVSGNETTATARGNIAINSLVTDGIASNGTEGPTPQASATVNLIKLTASAGSNGATNNALTNVQFNSGSVTAGTVGAPISGAESIVLAGSSSAGAVNSTVTLDNNIVTAEADGNVGGNTLTLTGTNLYSNGALTSLQTNAGAISANASGSVTASITGGTATAAGTSGSTVDVSGNQTVATARGNSATNALNATPSSNYGAQTVPAGSVLNNTPGVSTATASYALLNVQDNTGAVSATSTATYSVTLTSTAGSPASVTGSSASVTGNQIAANAFGNSASNTMTLAALNSGNATAALNNTQVNSGAINASVTGGTNSLTVGPTGGNGSTFTVSSNTITARAVGNAAVNIIGMK